MIPSLERAVRRVGLCPVMLLIFIAAGAPSVWAQTYTTSFPATENPISEGGKWIDGKTVGLDWGDISTTPGQTHDHSGAARYADATAILTGSWGPDQTAQATVYAGSVSGAPEVELRLRSSLSAHQSTGYEISNSVSGGSNGSYLIIVRWNGPLADFTYLAQLNGPQFAVTTGDVVKATIVGNVITSYKNGVQMAQVTDNTYSTGNPGMGFNEGTNGTYGYTNFSATGTGSAVPPTITTQPANRTVTVGQTATFSVVASGTPPPSYQWQHQSSGSTTWANVGTNSASYTTAATLLSDSGSTYRVVVTNSAGSVTSNPATLTVSPPDGGTLPAPWQDQDIGTVGAAGSASFSEGTFTIIGGGADIWGGSDQFNFVSQPLSRDADIAARVAGLGNTNGWAKAGVMIRQSLSADSSYAFTAITPANGAVFQHRDGKATNATSDQGPMVVVPEWVRLIRKGDTFTSYVSADGVAWSQIGAPITIVMGTNVVIGFAVTSHDNAVTTAAMFDHLEGTGGWQSGGVTPTPVPPPSGVGSSGGGSGGGGGGCGAVGAECLLAVAILRALRSLWKGRARS